MRKYFLILVLLVTACAPKPNQNENAGIDFCAAIHRNDSLSLTAQLASLRDSMLTKTGVYVLEDGAGAMVLRAWLSEYAEQTIDIQYFIFSTDNVGLIACDYLVRAADRGVKVRILVDDIMVDADIEDVLMLDSHENISIKIYNPGVNLGKSLLGKIKKFATDFRSANQRMHNKTFTVDGKVVITGGRNIADEYFDYDHEYNFRDRDVLLIGKAAKTVNQSFESYWNHSLSVPVTSLGHPYTDYSQDTTRFDKLHAYACDPENFWPQVRNKIENLTQVFEEVKKSGALVWVDDVDFIADEPGKNETTSGLGGGGITTSALIALVQKAEHSLDIQTPYLITTELSQELFRKAVARGVKVRILTNSLASTDNVEAFSGYQKDRKKLLETGVRIFEYRPDAEERNNIMTGELQKTLDHQPIFGLHAKSMVIDEKTTVIGTFNLDPRSANLNTECVTIIQSEKIARGVLVGMEEEFKPANSWETTITSNPDSVAGKMKRIKSFTRRVIPKEIL